MKPPTVGKRRKERVRVKGWAITDARFGIFFVAVSHQTDDNGAKRNLIVRALKKMLPRGFKTVARPCTITYHLPITNNH